MDTLTLAAFEERASVAEARLAALESRIATQGTPAPPQDAPVPSTADLAEIRQLLVRAQQEAAGLQSSKDQMVSELAALHAENLKLKYRIVHLKQAVQEGDARLKVAHSSSS
ncbi:uncharacterized protein HaLaN_21514, partial [Haematococcus lacustris]